ncbi:MAG: BamA/TamA family outer membrane protein [Gemmatimonadales bacterium]
MKKTLLILVAATTLTIDAAAQLPSILPAHHPLMDPWYPKVFYGSLEGFTFGGYYAIIDPIGFADEDFRPPYKWSVSLDGHASTSGSRQLTLSAQFPAAFTGWRFGFEMNAQRRAREFYFGIGNNSVFDQANEQIDEFFYRSKNLVTNIRGGIQRRILPNLWVLVGFHTERWTVDTLTSTGQLARDAAARPELRIGVGTNDISARVGLVFDSRSDEIAPRDGLLIEAIVGRADSSMMGDLTYTRTTVSARGYASIGQHWVLAARVMGQNQTGTPAIGSLFMVESGRTRYNGIGGTDHRGLADSRLIGPGKLLVNVDVRYDIFPYPSFFPVTLVWFLDAGRVFDQDQFRITAEGLKIGGGGGVFLQIGRAGIAGITLGAGPDGLHTEFHTAWPF